MITWISRVGTAAATMTFLAACEGGQGLGGVTSAKPEKVLNSTDMGFGAVKVVAPGGYCIDADSITQRFALMARCDQLDAETSNRGAPIGVITVSVAAAADIQTMPTSTETATALALTGVSDQLTSENSVIFRAVGTSPAPRMSPTHWRATMLINGHLLGLAFYGPEGGAAAGPEGGAILADLIEKTAAAQ